MLRNFVRHSLFISALFSLIAQEACNQGNPRMQPVSANAPEIKIKRYEQALFRINPSNVGKGLDSLSGEFHFFIGDNYSDTLNIIQIHDFITDPFILDLYRRCNETYPDLSSLEKDLTLAFRNLKYYFPKKASPIVFSYVSGLLYESPVQYYDSVMIIALDMYLGKDFEPYHGLGLPYYKARRMSSNYILPDCMREVASSLIPPGKEPKTLLDHMILQGKFLYLLDVMLPEAPDSLKTGYSSQQSAWCAENESNIWAFMIENELLYSTDSFIIKKFLLDGPFTTGFPPESPAMLGAWTGWQIIRSFVKDNKSLTPNELILMNDSQKLLLMSKYKPRK